MYDLRRKIRRPAFKFNGRILWRKPTLKKLMKDLFFVRENFAFSKIINYIVRNITINDFVIIFLAE